MWDSIKVTLFFFFFYPPFPLQAPATLTNHYYLKKCVKALGLFKIRLKMEEALAILMVKVPSWRPS